LKLAPVVLARGAFGLVAAGFKIRHEAAPDVLTHNTRADALFSVVVTALIPGHFDYVLHIFTCAALVIANNPFLIQVFKTRRRLAFRGVPEFLTPSRFSRRS
jgi:hypothetical protein